MSNRRRPALFNVYRNEFLRSPAWFARRDRWFTHHATLSERLTCAGCGRTATRAELELHHLDYRGVRLDDGRWRAGEADEDLVAMHPYCHDLLHRLIDRDALLARGRTRRTANHLALQRLRLALQPTDGSTP
ncbi:hypothetical protein [Microbacterium yannicii]|uniref:hypothetical protein n=1 Tax=Microbacterium yannicii TaxID=671622 RepID=UPI0002F4DE6D|nr:hypothetical protein [Microbacterium yannicii]